MHVFGFTYPVKLIIIMGPPPFVRRPAGEIAPLEPEDYDDEFDEGGDYA